MGRLKLFSAVQCCSVEFSGIFVIWYSYKEWITEQGFYRPLKSSTDGQTVLDTTIQAAQKELTNNPDKYTEETAAALKAAINEATEVLNDDEATKRQYEKSTSAVEAAIAALVTKAEVTATADKAAADAAAAKIGAIGTVEYTDASKAKIDEARAAYDALTGDQKALVSAETVKVLTDAEAAYAALKATAEKPIVNEVTVNGGVYQLNHVNGTARFVKPTSKNLKKLVILDSVQANDRNYLVTEVKAGAGRGMKKLTTLTVGANVKKIGSNAFRDCVKLKKIILKNPKMKMKGFGKDSFRNIKAKATFKVKANAKVMKKYKKWLIGKAKAPATIKVKKGK